MAMQIYSLFLDVALKVCFLCLVWFQFGKESLDWGKTATKLDISIVIAGTKWSYGDYTLDTMNCGFLKGELYTTQVPASVHL